MKNLLVSIVVPVYNVEKYLKNCVHSILQQTYKNIEILLIDDGSTDCSGLICDKFLNIDNRVKVFHKNNGGLSSARNFGINKAIGNYIAFIDSDDIVHSTFIETLLQPIASDKLLISECATISFFSKKDIFVDNNTQQCMLNYKEWITQTNVGDFLSCSACNKLYNIKLFEDISFPEGKNHEDEATTYKLVYKAKKIFRSYSTLYFYRKREGSITSKDSLLDNFYDAYEALENKCKFFMERDEYDIYYFCRAKLCIFLISRFFVCCSSNHGSLKKEIIDIYNEIKKKKSVPYKYKLYIKVFIYFPLYFKMKYMLYS